MLHKVKEFFEKNDRFAKLNGMEIVEIDKGYSEISMVIKEEHLNGADTVHGGAIFSLADFALAVASNTHGKLSLVINASISFLNAGLKGETLIAKAQEIDTNHKLGNYTVTITTKEGKTIASFQGMVYKKDKQIV